MEGNPELVAMQEGWIRAASDALKDAVPAACVVADDLVRDDVLDFASSTLLDAAIDHGLLTDDLRSLAMEMLENGGFGRATPWATERLLKG